VAHEINNPINGIINYAEILASKSSNGSKENSIANRIIKEGDRIANIVNNLLVFARNSNKEKKHPVHINEVMSDTLSLTRSQLKKEGIHLSVNIPLSLPNVIAHPQQIEQVFLNIINNARYALNKKYPVADKKKVLKIYGKQVTSDNALYVQIIFADSGIGIPPEIMTKIKNPFFTTKPAGIGTGLGLSISHGIISDHGGQLTIESSEGEFTKASVDLPAMIRS